MNDEFPPSNSERFIYSNEENKHFSKNMTEHQFNEIFKEGKYVEIPLDLPKESPRRHYLASLLRMKAHVEKDKEKALNAARLSVEAEYRTKIDYYDRNIKKMEALIFLEKEHNIILKQENGEAFLTSSES